MKISNRKIAEHILLKLKNNEFPGNRMLRKGKMVDESWGVGSQVFRDTPLKPEMFDFSPTLKRCMILAIEHSIKISTKPFNDNHGIDRDGEQMWQGDGNNYGDGGPPQLILDYTCDDYYTLKIECYEREPFLSKTHSNIIKLKFGRASRFLEALLDTDILIYDLDGTDIRRV